MRGFVVGHPTSPPPSYYASLSGTRATLHIDASVVKQSLRGPTNEDNLTLLRYLADGASTLEGTRCPS